MIHLSIDDVICSFELLTSKRPDSIFEVPLFSFLRKMHKSYGVVFSCYCFFMRCGFDLSQCTRSYREEFVANADWLRFGFHGYSGVENYQLHDIDESKRQYEETMRNLLEIVGKESIDDFPRIHFFQASNEFIAYMSSHPEYPVTGLLTADDDRLSYGLSEANCKRLIGGNRLCIDGVCYLRTSCRFDYLKPNRLLRLFRIRGGQIVLFTHEWIFYPSNTKKHIKAKVIKDLIPLVIRYYLRKGNQPGFPMER